MKTKQQREAEFRADLAELLRKHGAEINITDDHKPWGMHSGICEISMSAEWDVNGNETSEYTEFNL